MRQAGILQGHRCCSSSASPLLLNQLSQNLDKNRHCQIEKVHFCQCIVEHTAIQKDKLQNLAGFHAITGYDTTSNLAGHSKTTCLKVFMQHPYLLSSLGKETLTDETLRNAEIFITRVYGVQDCDSVNMARSALFRKAHAPETLPPTSVALLFHIKRAHYQTAVWLQAHLQHPRLPPPETMGWRLENGILAPVLKFLPSVPDACVALS